jgi:hypothetical protein
MTRTRSTTESRRGWQLRLLGVGIVALVVSWLVLGSHTEDFHRGWLIGFLPCWEVTIGCLGLLMLHHLMGGNWGRAARPALEAGAGMLPVVAIGFVPIALNLEPIFPWMSESAAEDPILASKLVYLNGESFWIRAVVYFGVWLVTWRMLMPIRPVVRSDDDPEIRYPQRGALGLILLIVAASFAAIDWGMSLEPHWFSAIYGAIFVAGGAITAMSLAAIAVAELGVSNRVPNVARKRIRGDLGSLMLAMLMVWTYFAFSQFIIIWSADLPEESVWYLARQQGGWRIVAMLVVAAHFIVPFALLLSQDVRTHPRLLARTAQLLLAAHVAYLVWVIAPAFYPAVSDVPLTALASLVGMISLWGAGWLFLLDRQTLA